MGEIVTPRPNRLTSEQIQELIQSNQRIIDEVQTRVEEVNQRATINQQEVANIIDSLQTHRQETQVLLVRADHLGSELNNEILLSEAKLTEQEQTYETEQFSASEEGVNAREKYHEYFIKQRGQIEKLRDLKKRVKYAESLVRALSTTYDNAISGILPREACEGSA